MLITPGAAVVGKRLADLRLDREGVEVRAMRRGGVHIESGLMDICVEEGDVLVLFGSEDSCAAAQISLMQG